MVGRSVCVLSVCLLATFVNSAKTAKTSDMAFGGLNRVGPWNHVLDEGSDPPREGANVWGLFGPFKSIDTDSLHCGLRCNRGHSERREPALFF